jgi:uracil-DNA glycosylase
MVDAARVKSLPLAQFREEVLSCQECFEHPQRCAHHEDVVGGYKPGRVVIVGLNPQAPTGHPEVSEKPSPRLMRRRGSSS